MSIRSENSYLSMMARSIERAIISSGNPYVDEYLESMDCSVQVELEQLRLVQGQVRQFPDTDKSITAQVLYKYLFGWKSVDRFFACVGLKPSAKWADGWYAAQRA